MNQLARERSPYLLQHANDPVDWQTWRPETFEQAKKQDRPVFLSIGYSTCHWCHVMAGESFSDPAVAEILNRSYVAVKVDREERPDVDGVYMAACVAVNGSGGWPLTVLMTPEQEPFWVGTYLRKDDLLSLLTECARLWAENRPLLLETGGTIARFLQETPPADPDAPDPRQLIDEGIRRLQKRYDPAWGGFSRAPKFPAPHQMLFLLGCGKNEDDPPSAMAVATLEHILRGGIHDPVGGGFFRYATDARWMIPHFEKMLYDNVLMLLALAEGWALSGRAVFREAADQTVSYLLREMRHPAGAFACAQDADSSGGEGRYYLFDPGELASVLGKAPAEAFCHWFGVFSNGRFEGKCLPNRLHASVPVSETPEITALREQVLRYRQERMPLRRDDKILTAWNGLAIAALARAGVIFENREYVALAQEIARFLCRNLLDENGRLFARWCAGEAAHPGKLEDHTFLSWGALELYAADGNIEWLELACHLADVLLSVFFDPAEGGFYPYASDGEQLIARRKEAGDGALPSGNSVAGLVLSRLAGLTGELRWQEAADRQRTWLSGQAADDPPGHAFFLRTLWEDLLPSEEVVVASGEPLPEELLRVLRADRGKKRSVLYKTPASAGTLGRLAPYTLNYPIPETGFQCYVCRDYRCSRPVSNTDEVKALLL